MTDLEIEAWYADPARRPTVIAEVAPLVAGSAVTRRMCTIGYTTYPTDVLANTAFLPIMGSPRFTEALTLDLSGKANLSGGEIEVDNPSGVRDSWLLDMWVHRPIKIWVGDVRWAHGDFVLRFDGVTANLVYKSNGKLAILLRDKLERLNTPITEAKLGGSTPNKDEIIPWPFGEVHNITPLLVDPTVLEYQVAGGPVEDIDEVRDNGDLVPVTKDNVAGKFRLTRPAAGAITASVMGDKAPTYNSTVAPIIKRLVTGFGKATDRFTDADIDTANFTTFDSQHTQLVGKYIGDRTNVLVACQQLAASVGAQVSMSRLGLLRLLKVDLSSPGTALDIPQHWMVEDSLKIASRPDVRAAVKLAFCRSYTVQEGLQVTIPAQHLDLFATEWLTETAIDTAVRDTYKLHSDPAQEDTDLMRRVDAAAEALRRLNLWKVQRAVYEFTAYAPCLKLSLGQWVRIYNTRLNLNSGAVGMVISLTPDWQAGRVIVQVLV